MLRQYLPSSHGTPTKSFWANSRGQTLNDFAIGTTIFLFTVLFVFAFVPSIFSPFGLQTDTGESIRVDRSAEHLTQSVIGTDGESMVLDSACTEAFFANTTVSDCNYTPKPLDTTFGNQGSHSPMNITIVDSTGNTVTHNGVTLERGSTPTQGSQITSIRRVVYLNGNTYSMLVKTW